MRNDGCGENEYNQTHVKRGPGERKNAGSKKYDSRMAGSTFKREARINAFPLPQSN